MDRGELVDGRFELDAPAGSGGMALVWRALDRETGRPVALKVLRDPDVGDAARFTHEARILMSLAHPHVVRYLGHGLTTDGKPYLTLEWLEGETLADHLDRGPLPYLQALDLLRRVAGALGAAHARAIVHRDIKPSNLFLVGGSVDRVRVLDFGIARSLDATTTRLTRSGLILGTPGYMAPEQARGELSLGPAADVFSLGAVFFECVTGEPLFRGSHVMALLAKLLLEEAPSLVEVRPFVPPAVSALCDRMLSKDPSQRPADGAAVVEELDAIAEGGGRISALPRVLPSLLPISTTERRLLSLVTIAIPKEDAPSGGSEATMAARPTVQNAALSSVLRVVEPLGARADALVDGTILVMLSGAGNPADQAAHAARCALRVCGMMPSACVALVTGRGEVAGRLPVGAIVERAAELLEHGRVAAVVVDEVTRSLIDARFEIEEQGGLSTLLRERRIGDAPRTLLGKASPFVGRDRELRGLVDLVEEGFEESAARALLVTAPAGAGKSRLRQELLQRLRERRPDLACMIGSADSLGAGAAFALLGSGLRVALSLSTGEPATAQREKIAQRVAAYVDIARGERVTEFLGELMGVPCPDEGSVRVRAAREDPRLMADQIEMAFIDFARAVSRHRPALVVLEDLQWGDAGTVKLLDTALRELKEERFAVLAFARPEVHERFPRLWDKRSLSEVNLSPLSRRAAEAVVRAALGEGVSRGQVAALVERAEGNAFYLEELIRAVAEGRGEELPETVLGMVEARLGTLPAGTRRLLRAASVFGHVFWKNGALALLGEEGRRSVDGALELLVEREFVVVRSERRFAGEAEYAFQHALVREGAYAMLTGLDRAKGHRLAGEWLSRVGEQDPLVLAAHFARGGEEERAAGFYGRAADQALEAGDPAAALDLAARGAGLSRGRDVRAGLKALEADAHNRGARYALGLGAAKEALSLSRQGSRSDLRALGAMINAALFSYDEEELSYALGRLLRTTPEGEAMGLFAHGMSFAIQSLLRLGRRAMVELYLQRLLDVTREAALRDMGVRAWVEQSEARYARYCGRDIWSALAHDRESARLFEGMGDRGCLAMTLAYVGFDLVLLGALEEAEQACARGLDLVKAGSAAALVGGYTRALLWLGQGRADEAQALAAAVERDARARGERMIVLYARLVGIEALLEKGLVSEAEREVLGLGEAMDWPTRDGLWALTVLADVRLRQGGFEEAIRLCERVLRATSALDMCHFRHASVSLLYAEALRGAGREEEARRAIGEARGEVLARAERIPEGEYRRGFLERVAAHARICALAREWLGE